MPSLKNILCNRVGIHLLNDFTDTHPKGQICEDFHHTALICKRRFLKDRQILHQTIVNDIRMNVCALKYEYMFNADFVASSRREDLELFQQFRIKNLSALRELTEENHLQK